MAQDSGPIARPGMMTRSACPSIARCIELPAFRWPFELGGSTLSDPENDIAPEMDEAERAAEDAAQQAAVQAAADEAARETAMLTALDSTQPTTFDPPSTH